MKTYLSDDVLKLIERAFDDLHSGAPLSRVLEQATRIARLRGDFDNLIWLEQEGISGHDAGGIGRLHDELEPCYATKEVFEDRWARMGRQVIQRRTLPPSRFEPEKGEREMLGWSVGEVEIEIQRLDAAIDASDLPEGMHSLDVYFESRRLGNQKILLGASRADFAQILERIRQAVSAFLSQTEREIRVGQAAAEIFERNREYVDHELRRLSPTALEQLIAAYRRKAEGDPEARAHALTSCRRVLKSLADAVYPATNEEVKGLDGKRRKMTDDKYITRLLQFAGERISSRSARAMATAEVSALADRIEALNSIDSKGVHDAVTEFEVDQCIIKTYLLVGDLLKLSEEPTPEDGASGEESSS